MAEAAALALAARTANNLNFSNNVSFLSDSSQLVQFITSEDHSHPPDWRMKPFTQEFDICTTATQANLYKISRTLNTTADALARQAFFGSETSFQSFQTTPVLTVPMAFSAPCYRHCSL